MSFFNRIELVFRLGVVNVLRVLWYRFALVSGLLKQSSPIQKFHFTEDFFRLTEKKEILYAKDYDFSEAEELCTFKFRFFFHKCIHSRSASIWHENPISKKLHSGAMLHWTEAIQMEGEDDIKVYWDRNRFGWLLTLMVAYSKSDDSKYLEACNQLLMRWCDSNPLYQGANWGDGQEASIRALHILCAQLLYSGDVSQSLLGLMESHLKRVSLTTYYAEAQLNNHILCESLALYLCGNFLAQHIKENENLYHSWAKKGRALFVKYTNQLILDDGGFSLYSTNYHRSVLQLFSLSLIGQKKLNLKVFDHRTKKKMSMALDWHFQLTDPSSGETPNLGNNDGSYLFKLNSMDFRNHKNAINLLAYCLHEKVYYQEAETHFDLLCFFPEADFQFFKPRFESRNFKETGILKYSVKDSWFCLKYPSYRFRPVQCDFLHFDFWYDGINILFDPGSYSYKDRIQGKDLAKIEQHNSFSIPNVEPMPKVSRFLYSNWPRAELEIYEFDSYLDLKVHYTDYLKNKYTRKVQWKGNHICITDHIHSKKHSNFESHWNLDSSNEVFIGQQEIELSNKLKIKFSSPIEQYSSYKSEYYYHFKEQLGFKARSRQGSSIETEIILPN